MKPVAQIMTVFIIVNGVTASVFLVFSSVVEWVGGEWVVGWLEARGIGEVWFRKKRENKIFIY